MIEPGYFPTSYLLLEQEGHLFRSCLTVGLTNLRKATVHDKGRFYSGLFNLSIGLERLLKALIIIEHIANNNGKLPSRKQLKSYGHNINELIDACSKIGQARNVEIPATKDLCGIQKELISLLNDFALTARYHNLDALTTNNSNKDPLERWGEILLVILENDVPKNTREKILNQAHVIAEAIDDITVTICNGFDKKPLSTSQAIALPGLQDQAAKHAVLHIIKVLSPLRELSSTLSHLAYTLGTDAPVFPQMQEFLDWAWDDRQYVLRKKQWP